MIQQLEPGGRVHHHVGGGVGVGLPAARCVSQLWAPEPKGKSLSETVAGFSH